ncbi:hypothetical protein [Sphingomonas xinjiangensis]|uniref:Uncharacterized protein n=1 Tax=Sphingomonas xinjiangensis TaxID=643568 RepID=A0A840YLS5_9SPHN|nr:hypothetical protein [Sphingomonas xinjiangensis]MBB5712338.1 hypothetical protein [Sphingomonas xinjiangensis]
MRALEAATLVLGLMVTPAAANAAPTTPGVQSPVRIECRYADFEFAGSGDTADVVDRAFKDDPFDGVATVRVSPKKFVIAWERRMSTLVGPRVMRNNYAIDRVSGHALVQTSDETAGIPPIDTESEEECRISS